MASDISQEQARDLVDGWLADHPGTRLSQKSYTALIARVADAIDAAWYEGADAEQKTAQSTPESQG